MAQQNSRREFMKNTSALAAGLFVAPAVTRAASEQKLKFGIVGAGGRGGAGVAAGMNEEFVALCDVDLGNRAKGAVKRVKDKFAGVKVYSDYREMFDKHKDLDAVWVATPDHNHFAASIRALDNGANLYCEKPLTHNIWESRRLREVAAAKKAVTQMGNQGHSSDSIRLIVEYIRGGKLGDVT